MSRRAALISLFTTLLAAQTTPPVNPPAGPTRQIRQRLLATAALGRTTFTAEWRWAGSQTTIGALPPQQQATATGTFFEDGLLVTPTRAEPTAVLQLGRHTLLRRGDGEWRLVGNLVERGITFLPDPQLLLRLLAASELQIGDRSTGERDGRAVELVALTLTAAQTADLVFAGALLDPQPLPTGLRRMMEQRGVAESELPTGTVDVGLEFDVATGLLSRLRVRALTAPTDTARIRQLAGGRAAQDAPIPAAEPSPAAPTAPLRYEDGLPVRAVEGMQERTLDLRLRDHGKAPALELDARQRRLLGLDD